MEFNSIIYYIFTNLYLNILMVIMLSLIFAYIIYMYSNLMNSFFVYHPYESFLRNILSRLRLTLIFSIPFTLILYVGLSNLYYRSEDINFLIATTISAGFLLIIRLISIQTKILPIKLIQINGFVKYSDIENFGLDHTKRVITVFQTFLYGALIIIYIGIAFFYFILSPNQIFIPISYPGIIINFIILLGIYISIMWIFVIIGEMILFKLNPLINLEEY